MIAPKKKVVFAGLDPQVALELTSALHSLAVEVAEPGSNEGAMGFCSPSSLKDFRSANPGVPVVVVTCVRQVSEWLDAMESGAQDYCSAPFEPGHLGWILKSITRPSVPQAA